MIERVIVAGGGTGGHLFPGIAVVEELRRRNADLDVLFVGTERGLEARVIPERGERLELMEVSPLKGRSVGQLMRSVAMLPGAMARSVAIVKREKPDLVIGVGGYASGPLLAAAAMLGVPTAVLEQNARVGLANRMLAPVVGRAYVTFPETAATFPANRVKVSGNPVRRAFVEAARRAAVDPDGFEARARKLLVIGGSQGARALNETLPDAVAKAQAMGATVNVLHQSGAAMHGAVTERYAALGVEAEVVPFIDDMASAVSSAALVVARAGATTVAELCAVGRPSVLIPYPHAADDHQGKNAEALERAGAARCIREDALSREGLAQEIQRLLGDEAARRAMTEAARAAGHPEAAAAIVDDLSHWLGLPGASSAARDGAAGTGEVEAGDDSEAAGGGSPPEGASMRGAGYYVPRALSRTRPRRSSVPVTRRPIVVSWGE